MDIEKLDVSTYAAPNGATYELKIAKPSAEMLQRRLKSKIYCFEDALLMKRCARCRDYWPADTEFFYSVKVGDGINTWCKACYQEWRYPNGRKESKH